MSRTTDFSISSATVIVGNPSVSSLPHPSNASQPQCQSRASQGLDVSLDRQSELISIDVLAKRLDCSSRHIRRLADSGRIPRPIKLGALLRWVTVDIDRWIAAGCPTCRKGDHRNGH